MFMNTICHYSCGHLKTSTVSCNRFEGGDDKFENDDDVCLLPTCCSLAAAGSSR